MIDADLWLARIRVDDHACPRIRDRAGWHPDDPRVTGEIRVGLLEGRWSCDQPAWTRGEQERPRRSKERSRIFVWEPTFARCWVLARGPSFLTVVTLLLDRRVWGKVDEEQRLVRGRRA